MKRLLWIMIALMFLAFSGLSCASPNMEEGLWQMTVTTEMPGMSPQSHTFTTCLTKEKAVPQQEQSNCKIEYIKTSGNTVTWSVVCNEGMAKSKGSVTYSGSTMEGVTETTVTTGGQTMTMKSTMKGKRIGPCNK